jgi:predicted MFS family arabinose efflux permease
MSMAAFYLVLALYLQQGRGLDPLRAGLIFVANGLGYLVTSSQVGRFERMSKRKIVAGAAILRAVGLAALLLAVSPSGDERSVLWLLPGLFLNGAGTGMTLSPLATLILSRVRAEHSGDASGVLNTVLQVGNAIGVAAVGIIFYGAATSANAFSRSLIYLIVLTLLLAALSQLFPHEHSSRVPNRA